MEKKIARKVFLGALLGSLVGVVLSGLLVVTFIYVLYKTQIAPLFDEMDFEEKLSESLEPPDFSAISPQAVYDWKITDLDGNEVDFTTFKGQLIFLNFWSTWCPPCVAEMPTIQRLHDHMGEKIQIVCISDERLETVKAFAQEKGYSFPIFVLKDDLPEVYETFSIPATFIINKEGEILFSHSGAADWGHESVVEYLNNSLETENNSDL